MASSFREIVWMDTDITPLVPPESLFETVIYKQKGALFWPDLWGSGCTDFGSSAWPHHVIWQVLELDYNASDPRFTHEHEPGLTVLDKYRHWKPICLANFLASRDFFTRVLHGYKDVFRFAWLKLKADEWFTPLRPGLTGAFIRDGRFLPLAMVHFWPKSLISQMQLGDQSLWPINKPLPLYLHQKKKPSFGMVDIVSFRASLGDCIDYHLGPLRLEETAGVELWNLPESVPRFISMLQTFENEWNENYNSGFLRFQADERLTEENLKRIHFQDPKSLDAVRKWEQSLKSCRCDYSDNRWFLLLSRMHAAGSLDSLLADSSKSVEDIGCAEVRVGGVEETVLEKCSIGFLSLSLICFKVSHQKGQPRALQESLQLLQKLLPSVSQCLSESFWPLPSIEELQFLAEISEDYASNASGGEGDGNGYGDGATAKAVGSSAAATTAARDLSSFNPSFRLQTNFVERFPHYLRGCLPLHEQSCWSWRGYQYDIDNTPWLSCLYCCDKNFRDKDFRKFCFDDVYTEELCCNVQNH
eukprot:TRINITY_DN9548_c0_g1_i1.p1 TRINITY_DN9548_c0_g1~~TRINITY_DN9548_c0_g1_i1.p1  ORF type:complete len:619 (-),score=83.62 TRINITY_DN9548_c0_g1_i1:72-1658(-)